MKAETSWGFMRGIQLSPTYSTVVQPCYMCMSVSGCVVYSYASEFKHICLSAPHLPTTCTVFRLKHTHTHTLTYTHWQTHKWWVKQDENWEKNKNTRSDCIQWEAEYSGWLNELQYQSRRDSAPSVREGTVHCCSQRKCILQCQSTSPGPSSKELRGASTSL